MFRNLDLRVHFVGIGGIGMSAIAEVLLSLGFVVAGSDQKASETTRRLESLGARIAIGHAEQNLTEADVVVISSAVKPTNPEVVSARARGIPVIPRAEMLAELMRMKTGIAIAGTHGKTTTTSLVATVMAHAGLDPTAVIGGRLPQLGSNARLGKSEYLVAEADESDGSFLHLSPTVAVVTNIDPEHLDHYGTLHALEEAFLEFANKVPFYGLAVICADHPRTRALLPRLEKRHVTYGFDDKAQFRATDVEFAGTRSRFVAWARGQRLGTVELAMPGRHNVQNAVAVLAVADFFRVPFDKVTEALADFGGVGRRFTVRAEHRGVLFVDDYGHHPAEIRATLAGARGGFPGRRIVAVFQPHRYTRTRDLFDEFARAFADANVVVVSDIYAAGEEAIPGVDSAHLVERMREAGHPAVEHVGPRAQLPAHVVPLLQQGDLVITLGAGDISASCGELAQAFAERAT